MLFTYHIEKHYLENNKHDLQVPALSRKIPPFPFLLYIFFLLQHKNMYSNSIVPWMQLIVEFARERLCVHNCSSENLMALSSKEKILSSKKLTTD